MQHLKIGCVSALWAFAPDWLMSDAGKLGFAVVTAAITTVVSRIVGAWWDREKGRK